MVGGIYLAKIYFTNLSDYKIRPVMVIKQISDDCICLQLTSKSNKNILSINNSDLSSGNIKIESFVVVPKNFTLHKDVLFKKIAVVNNQKLNNIFNLFCKEINCPSTL